MPVKIFVYPSWLDAIAATLNSIFIDGKLSDKEIPKTLKSHPKWGSKDRRMVATALYEICRNYRKYAFQVFGENIPENKDNTFWELLFQAYCIQHQFEITNPEIFKTKIQEPLHEPLAPPVIHSLNDELYEAGSLGLKDNWEKYLQYLNIPSLVYLRVNTLKTSSEKLIKNLVNEGINVTEDPELNLCLIADNSPTLRQSKAFKDSLFEFQDKGSQLIGHFCNVKPYMKVADVCAGLGGKTLHLSALMENQGTIIASDIDPLRLKKLGERAKNAHCKNIKIQSQEELLSSNDKFDVILLDVPCSGTGTIKRQADIKWNFTLQKLAELNNIQLELLEKFSKLLHPEGELIYATCSVLPQENEFIIQSYIEKSNFRWKCISQKSLFPDKTDGFFMARLKPIF